MGAPGEGAPHPAAEEVDQRSVEKGRRCQEPAATPPSVDLVRVAGRAPSHPRAGRARAERTPLQQEGLRQSLDRVLAKLMVGDPVARGQPAERALAGPAPWGRGAQGRAVVVPAQVALEPAEQEQQGCPVRQTRLSAPVAGYRPARATDFGGLRSPAGRGRAVPDRSDRPRAPARPILFAGRSELPAPPHRRSPPACKIRRLACTKSHRPVRTERALAPRDLPLVAPTLVRRG